MIHCLSCNLIAVLHSEIGSIVQTEVRVVVVFTFHCICARASRICAMWEWRKSDICCVPLTFSFSFFHVTYCHV